MSEADWGHIETILGGAAVFIGVMAFMFGAYRLCK
jgi:hypothetical protein